MLKIFAGLVVVFFCFIFLGMTAAMWEDTETFRAIDEKIAKWLRGKSKEGE